MSRRSIPIAAISGDGERWVARGDDEDVFVVREVSTNEVVSSLRVEMPDFAHFERVVLDRAGEHALFGISDRSASLVRVSDGKELKRYYRPGSGGPSETWTYVRAVCLSDDAGLVAAAFGGLVCAWSQDGKLMVSVNILDHQLSLATEIYPRTLKGRLAWLFDYFNQRPEGRWLSLRERLPEPRSMLTNVVSHLEFSGAGTHLMVRYDPYYYMELELSTGKVVGEGSSREIHEGVGGVYGGHHDSRSYWGLRTFVMRDRGWVPVWVGDGVHLVRLADQQHLGFYSVDGLLLAMGARKQEIVLVEDSPDSEIVLHRLPLPEAT